MNVSEIIGLIEEAESKGLERFYLVVPRRFSGRRSMRILPGLLGEVCCENDDGRTVTLVRCDEARSWLQRNHLAGGTMVAWGLPANILQTALAWAADHRPRPITIRLNHLGPRTP